MKLTGMGFRQEMLPAAEHRMVLEPLVVGQLLVAKVLLAESPCAVVRLREVVIEEMSLIQR